MSLDRGLVYAQHDVQGGVGVGAWRDEGGLLGVPPWQCSVKRGALQQGNAQSLLCEVVCGEVGSESVANDACGLVVGYDVMVTENVIDRAYRRQMRVG